MLAAFALAYAYSAVIVNCQRFDILLSASTVSLQVSGLFPSEAEESVTLVK